MKVSKKQHYATFFVNNLNNLKSTWKGIKELINLKPNVNVKPSSLKLDNRIISDDSEISNIFNKYFADIAGKLSQKIIHTDKLFTDFLTNTNENSFFIQPVLEDELFFFFFYFHSPYPRHTPLRFFFFFFL